MLLFELSKFHNEIYLIDQSERLVSLKEELKNEIKDPLLKWEARMILYKKVQLINDRIVELQTLTPKH